MKRENISILVVDDEAAVRNSLCDWFQKDGYDADKAADGAEALKKFSQKTYDIALLDIKMPNIDGMELQKRIKQIDPGVIVIMITAYASVDTAVEALKEGAFDYVTKPIDPDDLSRLVGRAVEQRMLRKENIELRKRIDELAVDEDLIGESAPVEKIRELVDTVSKSDVTVLIRGESGTGKELIAKLIHAKSARRYFPLVAVNCGALHESLLESELFGHEKGSFTGAQYRHKGKLEVANGGTLFLDEIGTIGLKTQIDLLRALESKQFTRLGGNQMVSSDFRVICATNQDLEQLMKEGQFREDFYYRVNVFPITIPPLRERREDIPALVAHFVDKFARQMNKPITGVTREAMDILSRHEWPGNVRELKNAIERAVVACRHPEITPECLSLQGASPAPAGSSDTLDAIEKSHIAAVLRQTAWNITQAAKRLDIDRVTLYNKIKKYGLSKQDE
jgi:two-component system response regulator HydG